jgi:hypothetical protein
MSENRISQKEFKEKYGGDLSKLQSAVALQPKKQPEAQETAETKPKRKLVFLEYNLQKAVAKYLNLKYPKALFESSPINLSLTEKQRGMLKAIQKDGFHPPDMKIYEARREYVGLALELKKESPYLLDGVTLKKDKHLENQQRSIETMREKGWFAGFYWEFDTIKTVIDWYFEEEN